MTLREVTRTVISLVENASGCPVVISEDASVTTLAAWRIARGAKNSQGRALALRVGQGLKVENLPKASPPRGQMDLLSLETD